MQPALTADFLAACRHVNEQDEAGVVDQLLQKPPYGCAQSQCLEKLAGRMVEQLRQPQSIGSSSLVSSFLREYGLTDTEGVALMCLAESVLRIPDADTRGQLVADKIGSANWQRHLGQADSLWVNASTWALLLSSKAVGNEESLFEDPGEWLSRLSQRLSVPVVQQAVSTAIRLLGAEFVFSEDIGQAVKRARTGAFSFDMLGEGARDEASSQRYFDAYCEAIDAVAQNRSLDASISIKLSALHPRLELAQRRRIRAELLPRLRQLCARAQSQGVAITIDAEESWRLLPTLDLFAALLSDPTLASVRIGLVVQAYSKRAQTVLAWLGNFAASVNRRIPVRLVKGAYWDAEIKHAQQQGYTWYPVFTQKAHTDLNYLACAKEIFAQPMLEGQFATHNAHTIAAIHHFAAGCGSYEFQRLHGMGAEVFDVAQKVLADFPSVRVYAPIGEYKDLLAYLIRRLLENGANSSFVHKLYDAQTSISDLIEDPVTKVSRSPWRGVHPHISQPEDVFPNRQNSVGMDLHEPQVVEALYKEVRSLKAGWTGRVYEQGVDAAFKSAAHAWKMWDATPLVQRGNCLRQLADLLQNRQAELVALLCVEAHKTLDDAVAEVREAIDFCRYYAVLGERTLGVRQQPGITGEINQLSLHGRGIWVCISPWNFPLAIFLGQCSAALISGNAVVAKPSEYTPQVAQYVGKLVKMAGFPEGVFNLVVGDAGVGEQLVKHKNTAGVALTGSTAVAQRINRALAARSGPIVPLIAETGGQNVMVVDSSALLEEVADDVIFSAFSSAGQRCSALRLLYLQEDISHQAIALVVGAMDELTLGPSWQLSTDVGPVIHTRMAQRLHCYIQDSDRQGRLLHQCRDQGLNDQFVAPALIKVEGIHQLSEEHFGPILHVATFKRDQFSDVIDTVNEAGFGLTMGLHTRLQNRVDYVSRHARVGNVYVNRNMVGAVVESQPFGGEGLSGTGPKAGGPFYLQRFVTERVVTVNTVAGGGNRDLLSL